MGKRYLIPIKTLFIKEKYMKSTDIGIKMKIIIFGSFLIMYSDKKNIIRIGRAVFMNKATKK